MSTLLLRLAAPMQSWGSASKFDNRFTEMEPTKSGVIGMLACAMGIKREDPLSVFADVIYGIRIDQTGELIVDFQMVHEQKKSKNMASWVTHRHYLTDAVFLAGIEGNREFLEEIEQALYHPVFPIYLGRRSCPPTGPISLGIRDKNLRDALYEEPWIAANWYINSSKRSGKVFLEVVRDAAYDEEGAYSVRDVPAMFSQKRRMYRFRSVIREQIPLNNVLYDSGSDLMDGNVLTNHDPMELLEGNDVPIKS